MNQVARREPVRVRPRIPLADRHDPLADRSIGEPQSAQSLAAALWAIGWRAAAGQWRPSRQEILIAAERSNPHAVP